MWAMFFFKRPIPMIFYSGHYNMAKKKCYYMQDHHEANHKPEGFEASKRILEQRGREKGIEKGTGKYLNRICFFRRIICGGMAAAYSNGGFIWQISRANI
jgi:site-specific DNA recombinase